ncbi:acyl-CoA dehydrogenase family protein [Chloroflexota bacterium]
MDFSFSEEQKMLRQSFRDFMERECTPEYVKDGDEQGKPPYELYNEIARLGWLGIALPKKYGGEGKGITELAIMLEEVARKHYALAWMIIRALIYGARALEKNGTEAQKKHFIPKIIKGESMFCFGLTEPEAGSDAGAVALAAKQDGDGYILNGQKIFLSGFHIADYCVLVTRTATMARRQQGITTFIVDTKSPGIEATPIPTLGMRTIPTNQVFFNDVKVPRENILGRLHEGWGVVMSELEASRAVYAVVTAGAASGVLEEAIKYAGERVQFGQPIGKFQAIRHKLADMQLDTYIAHNLAYRLAWMVDQGLPARKEAAMTKLFCSEAYNRVADQALQVFGGYGYAMDYPLQRHYRDSRLGRIGEGSSEIQRDIIARELGI